MSEIGEGKHDQEARGEGPEARPGADALERRADDGRGGRGAAGRHAVDEAAPHAHRAVKDRVLERGPRLVRGAAFGLAQVAVFLVEGIEPALLGGVEKLDPAGIGAGPAQGVGQFRPVARDDRLAEVLALELNGRLDHAVVVGLGQEEAAAGGTHALLDRFKEVHGLLSAA